MHFDAVEESLIKLEQVHDKSERALFKIVLWIVGPLVLFIVLAVVGYHQVRNWQVRRLTAEANALVDRGDYKRAGLDARRILQINPESVNGVRVLARIAERADSRAAVELWQRVVAADPDGKENYFSLAKVAIRFGDLKTARSALEKLAPTSKNTARYHELEADFALAKRDGPTVDRELSAAAQLDPGNKEYAFRLATLRLGASDAAMRAQAQQTLEQLQNDKQFRRQATRQLANYALRNGNTAGALALARQLDGFPERDFRDRVLLLTALYEAKDPALQSAVTNLEAAATQDPDAAGTMIMWLNTHGMSADAISWSKNLSPQLLSQRSIPLALSDSFITARDWKSLERLTKNGNWGELDFLRLALCARSFREAGDMTNFGAQWNEAVRKVSADADKAMMLSETASKWGWRGESIDLLWVVSKDPAKGEASVADAFTVTSSSPATRRIFIACSFI